VISNLIEAMIELSIFVFISLLFVKKTTKCDFKFNRGHESVLNFRFHLLTFCEENDEHAVAQRGICSCKIFKFIK
jgi:hypothetical protein